MVQLRARSSKFQAKASQTLTDLNRLLSRYSCRVAVNLFLLKRKSLIRKGIHLHHRPLLYFLRSPVSSQQQHAAVAHSKLSEARKNLLALSEDHQLNSNLSANRNLQRRCPPKPIIKRSRSSSPRKLSKRRKRSCWKTKHSASRTRTNHPKFNSMYNPKRPIL